MKKIFAAIISSIAISAVFMTANVFAEDTVNPAVTVNGKLIEGDTPAIIYNDRTLVPMRDIFHAAGAAVGYNEHTAEAVAVKGGDVVRIPINENIIYKNGIPIEIDVPAMIVNDRTMIPARAVSEALGCDVKWGAGIVSITADISHNPVLVDFLQNQFENTEIQIRDDNGGAFSDNPSYFTAKNKINSYIFIDIDHDGEEELIISSQPDVKAEELNWWDAPVGCLSIWDLNGGEIVNLYAKESVPHRMSYKPYIAASDDGVYLAEYYRYSSSGELFAERRKIDISGGKLVKSKEIVFREIHDYMNEQEYNSHIAAGDDISQMDLVESFVTEDGERRLKFAYGGEYILDGTAADRAAALNALNEFDRNFTNIYDCFDRWED